MGRCPSKQLSKMSKNKKIGYVEVEHQRPAAIESLKSADRYVVVIWNDEVGPDGGNVQVFANMCEWHRDKLLNGIMMMDKVNTNQN